MTSAEVLAEVERARGDQAMVCAIRREAGSRHKDERVHEQRALEAWNRVAAMGVPPDLRLEAWLGARGGFSCAHAHGGLRLDHADAVASVFGTGASGHDYDDLEAFAHWFESWSGVPAPIDRERHSCPSPYDMRGSGAAEQWIYYSGPGILGTDGVWRIGLCGGGPSIADNFAAGARFLVLDTCTGGGRRGEISPRETRSVPWVPPAVPEGAFLWAASAPDGWCDATNGRGLFTTAFLDAVAGAADRNHDGRVTLGEARRWVEARLRERGQQPLYIGDPALDRMVLGPAAPRLAVSRGRDREAAARIETDLSFAREVHARFETSLTVFPPSAAVTGAFCSDVAGGGTTAAIVARAAWDRVLDDMAAGDPLDPRRPEAEAAWRAARHPDSRPCEEERKRRAPDAETEELFRMVLEDLEAVSDVCPGFKDASAEVRRRGREGLETREFGTELAEDLWRTLETACPAP